MKLYYILISLDLCPKAFCFSFFWVWNMLTKVSRLRRHALPGNLSQRGMNTLSCVFAVRNAHILCQKGRSQELSSEDNSLMLGLVRRRIRYTFRFAGPNLFKYETYYAL